MLLRALSSMSLLNKFVPAVAMVEVMVHSDTVGVRFVLILLIRAIIRVHLSNVKKGSDGFDAR